MVDIIVQITELNDKYIKELEKYMTIEHVSKISKTVIGNTPEKNIAIIKTLPFVRKIAYNVTYKTQTQTFVAPEKPVDYVTQSGKFITNWEALQYHDPPTELTGKGIKIAILDTGVNNDHPLLKGKIIKNIQIAKGNINNPLHGTWIAGTLVARPKQIPVGLIKGVCPDAKIINIKVLDDNGVGTTSNIIKGLDAAIENGCKVANLSLASPMTDPILNDAINEYSKHIVLCCAGGNYGNNATVGCPASNPNTIGVGSIYPYNGQLRVSSFSPKEVDVVAIGGEVKDTPVYVVSTVGMSYKGMAGTSMATPFVTGAIALLLEKYPHLTPKEVLSIINSLPYYNQYVGHGNLNIKQLINDASNPQRIIHNALNEHYIQQNALPLLILLALLFA